MKINPGEQFLIQGYAFFEQSTVVSVEKNIVTLENGIKFNRKTMEPINTKFTVEPFDQDTFDYLTAKANLPKLIVKLQAAIRKEDMKMESVIKLHKKLTKIIENLS